MGWVVVAPLAAVPEGLSEHQAGKERIVVARQGQEVHALQASCPHKFARLCDGTLTDGMLTCPQHEAHFDVATGRSSETWAGDARRFDVRIVDGALQVDVP